MKPLRFVSVENLGSNYYSVKSFEELCPILYRFLSNLDKTLTNR